MEIFQTIIGGAATVVGTSLMVPQVYKSFKTKSVGDLSWWMLVLYFLNCLLWSIYGILIWAVPLMITNGIALCISTFQILLKVKYKNNQ